MAKILVTGSSGFIGKRITHKLLKEGHEVYASLRIRGTQLFDEVFPNLHIVYGDMRYPETYNQLPDDLDSAYYLMHSMSEIMGSFHDLEIEIAGKFADAMRQKRCKQIIYLSGIINDEKKLSQHLKSRLDVETVLIQSQVPYTILRASIIIGSGSASFEIIRDLVEKLPLMVAPVWVNSLCQPIAVRDVLFYLDKVRSNPQCLNKIFDVGGPDILSFKELLLSYAKVRGLKRAIITVPFFTPKISSYWLIFISSVKFSLAFYLVQSMKTNTVCQMNEILTILPHERLTYEEAIRLALQKIEQNEVISTWMDAWEIDSKDPDIKNFIEVPEFGTLKDVRIMPLKTSPEKAIERIWSLGGKQGWYALNWAWNLRGMLDKFIGGVGRNRGRRHPTELRPGDYVDFWRVIKADKKAGELILFADMRLPGDGWLEFKVADGKLKQTATLRPRGLFGRIYWYVLTPFHWIIFTGLAKDITGE